MADSIGGNYATDRRTADREEVLRWLAEPAPPPAQTPASETKPAATPAKPAEPKSAVKAGASAAWETFQQGAENIAGAIYSKTPQSVGTSVGQGVLGVLQMVSALPAGAGAAVQEAIKNYAPGLESSVAIGGGQNSAAGFLRTTLGVPGLLLDPKMKTADPRAVADTLNEPMTYGELINLAAQFIVPAAATKAVGAMKGGKPGATPAAPKVEQPASPARPLALPEGPGTPKALGPRVLETPPPGGTGGGMTPAEVAIELRTVLEQIPRPEPAPMRLARPFQDDAPLTIQPGEAGAASGLLDAQGRPLAPAVVEAISERDRLRAFERTPLDAPAKTAKPEGQAIPDLSSPTGTLESALDVAMKKTESVLPQWLTKPAEAVEATTGAVAETTPEAPPVAVYEALGYMWETLKEAEAGKRFLITDDVGKVEGGLAQPSTYPDWMNALTTKRTRAEADKIMRAIDNILDGKVDGPLEKSVFDWAQRNYQQFTSEPFVSGLTDEGGRIDAGLLARLAFGAAAGGSQGETPEERILGAFVGMGLGATLSRRLATKMAEAYKGSGLADESGALDFSKFKSRPRVMPGDEAFQPNYQRLVLTPELSRFSKNLHQMMKGEILERRGKPRSHEATVLNAETLIGEGKMTAERLLTLEGEAVLSRDEITAGRMIAQRSRDYALKLNEGFKAGQVPGPELVDAVAVAAAISKNVRVAQTRIAQAQEASRIKVGYDTPSNYRPEDVIHLADDLGRNATPEQISAGLDSIERPADRAKAIELAGVFPRAFLELMYFSQLSGKAVTRNAFSNIIMGPLAIGEMALAPYMPRWGKKAKDTRVLPGSATQMAIAWQEGMLDTFRLLKFWDKETRAELAGLQDRIGGGRQIESRYAAAISSENFGGGRAMDLLGATFRAPTNVLGTTDALSKMIAARMWQRFEAFHQAAKEGLGGEAMWKRVDDLTHDPTLLSDLARERVQDFAERQTLTKDFEGRFLGALQRGPEDPWLNAAYRWQVMPYFRTPMRGTEAGMLRFPGLNLLMRKFWEDMQAGGREQQIAQARVLFGAGILTTIGYLESQGGVTGDGPSDPKLKKLWQDELGLQERSFWDPIAKKWRGYNGLGVVSDLIAAGADMSAAARRTPGDLADKWVAGAVAMATSFDTKSYTRTLSELFSFMREGASEDSQWERFLALQRQRIAGVVQPGVLRELEGAVDPEVRRPRPSGDYPEGSTGMAMARELDMLVRQWKSQIPGLSSDIPPDRDRIDGNPTMIETFPFSPFLTRTPTNDELKLHIFGDLLGAGLSPFPEWLGGGRPVADLGLGTRPAENVTTGVRMTPEQKDRYAVLMTKEVKNVLGQTYRQALEEAVRDPMYQAESDIGPSGTPRDSGKAKWLQRIDQEFRGLAEAALLEELGPGHRMPQEIERRKMEREIRKTPTADQPGMRTLLESLPQGLTR